MQMFKRPVIPLLLGYMAGIVLGAHLAAGYVFALLLIAISGGITLRRVMRRQAALPAPIILMAALGHLAILPWVAPRYPQHHVIHHLSTDPSFVVGVVDSLPRQQPDRTKFIIRTQWLRQAETLVPVTGRVRITVAGDAPALQPGDRVELYGRLRPLQNFRNPGGFDFRRHMAYQRVWTSLYVPGNRVRLLAQAQELPFTARIQMLRRAAGGLIASHSQPPQTGVLQALLIGEHSGISPRLLEIFNRAGASHILAISGLHVGIVATVSFCMFQLLLRQIPALLQRAWSRKGAAVLTLIPVMGYGLMAGMSPSTQRAVLMTSVFLAAFWVERELDIFTTLATAAGMILIVHPPALFAVSFQLSFAAVTAIAFGLHWTKRSGQRSFAQAGIGKVPLKLLIAVKGMVGVSLLAIWGTMPLVMAAFNRLSLVGVAANLVVIPVIGFCVVPLGLAAIACWPVSEVVAAALLRLAARLLSGIIPLIEFMANQPLAAVTTWTPSILEMVCFYMLSGSMLVLVTNRRAAPNPAGEPARGAGEVPGRISSAGAGLAARLKRFRPKARTQPISARVAWLLLALGVLLATADALYWLNQRFWHRDLRVTVLDVGQGNAALVEFPGGRTMLIDGGGFADIAAFDLGADVLAPFLWRRKILSVDMLVLSHPNSDHMNGLIYIADAFNVQQLLTNGEPRPTTGYRQLMQTAAAKNIQRPDFRSLPREQTFGGVTCRLLHPPPDFLSRRGADRWRNTNNNSMVLHLAFGEHSFLFPGDIMQPAEDELVLVAGVALKSTVMVAPHHGSRTSNSAQFLAAVAPRWAVVSARDHGKQRYPHAAVVERYRRLGCRLFRTEQHGAICMRTDGRNLRIEPFVRD